MLMCMCILNNSSKILLCSFYMQQFVFIKNNFRPNNDWGIPASNMTKKKWEILDTL